MLCYKYDKGAASYHQNIKSMQHVATCSACIKLLHWESSYGNYWADRPNKVLWCVKLSLHIIIRVHDGDGRHHSVPLWWCLYDVFLSSTEAWSESDKGLKVWKFSPHEPSSGPSLWPRDSDVLAPEILTLSLSPDCHSNCGLLSKQWRPINRSGNRQTLDIDHETSTNENIYAGC